jgi:hypothetical protein
LAGRGAAPGEATVVECNNNESMEPSELDLLSKARLGIRAEDSIQKANLEALVEQGYLWRDEPRLPFPGAEVPSPIYRLTSDGLDLLEAIQL